MSDLNVYGTPLVDPNDVGVGPVINGVTWTFTVLSGIAVALRFYLRKRSKHRWTPDDWIMLVAMGLQIIYQALLTKACQWGLGKQYVNMTRYEYEELLKYQYIAQLFVNFNPLVSRISIALLLNSLFGLTRRWFKWLLISWTLFVIIGSLLTNLLTLTEKDPIKAEWDRTMKYHTRFNMYIRYYVAIGFVYQLAISDLIYVAFPISFVWKLHMPTHRKFGLSVLLGAGIVTFGAAIAKIVVSTMQVRGQVSATQAPVFGGVIFLISGIEQGLVIILGCTPTMGPLSKIATSFYGIIGHSLASLVTRGKRSLSRKSSRENSMSGENIEMGMAKRLSGESSPKARTRPSKEGYTDTTRYIRRTDDFIVTHTQFN